MSKNKNTKQKKTKKNNKNKNDLKFILICATGRSGSTTLLRLLNTIPNSNICGENNMVCELLQCYKNMKTACETVIPGHYNPIMSLEKCVSKKQSPCWYNSFDSKQVVSNIKKIIISMFRRNDNDIIVGFKEIRYFNRVFLLDEFMELFPNTKIIIHVRNQVEEQAQSSWWKDDPDAVEHLKQYNSQLSDYYNTNRNFCYLSTFEDMFSYEKITELFKFLGVNIDKQAYDTIMNDNSDNWT